MSSQASQPGRPESDRHCRNCGAPVGPRSSSTVCPRCALLCALTPEPGPGAPEKGTGAPIHSFGEYQIHSEIARGGMGVVYKARHIRLNRWVALKVMVGGEFASADFKQRFRTEAQAAAALEHPNIIPIYEVGEEDGQPYFSMKLVEAGTLTSRRPMQDSPIRGSRDEPPDSSTGAVSERHKISGEEIRRSDETPLQRLRTIAIAVKKLAGAVQFAHDRGVLHRDLKPNNVLVDSTGELFLTDFGLAKLVEKEASLTKTMAVLGTPSYMAPEQARGDTRQITTAADLYGLGAILYELIAGRPPFIGQSPLEIIQQVLEREPTAPSVVKNGGSFTTATTSHQARDLDTICLKCLEKEPNRRYASARVLAEDLDRWLNHEPIYARQASVLERVGKWIRRKPAWAALIATILLSLVALGAGSVLFTAQVMKARTTAEQANRELSRNLFIREWLDVESALDEGKIASALAWFARAARDHPADAAVQTRLLSLLTERSFVVPADRPLVHGSPLNTASFLSDGRHLATAAMDGSVRIWELNSHSGPLVISNRFENPAVGVVRNPNLLLVDDARSLSLWDGNRLVKLVPISHKVNRRLPISPDGRFAAICGLGSNLRLWDIADLKPVGPSFEGIEPYPPVVGFSPDGKYLLGTEKLTQLFVREISTGRLVWQTPDGPPFRGEGLVEAEVTPSGNSIIASCWLGTTGGELTGWTFKPSASTNTGPAIASPEGWTLPTRSPVGAWCFSKDGHELYVGDAEGHLGVVNLNTHELHNLNAEHEGRISWLGLSSDGQRLATASIDGTARLWDVRMKAPEPLMITNNSGELDATFSPDSRWFVCSCPDGTEIRDVRSGALLKRLPMKQSVNHVDISPDGRRVVAGQGDGRTVVWDTETGNPLYPAIESLPLDYVEFSRDGRWFLLGTTHAQVQVHETATGRQIGPTLTNTSRGVTVTFNPDSRSLVVGTDNGEIEFWSLPEGRRLDKPARHKDVVWTAHFTPDGKQLLTASRDRTAALWDAQTGTRIREFRHEQQVYVAAFSPDAKRIVTGDASRKAHVWDAQSGKRLFSLLMHPGGVWYTEFSCDGRLLLTGDDAGNARLWDASSGLPLSGWVHNGSSLKCAHFSPDGRMALSASQEGAVRIWSVLLAPQPSPGWLPELAETLAGHRLRDDGSPEVVPAERWEQLQSSLKAKPGDDFYAHWSKWFLLDRMQPNPREFGPR